MTPRDGDLFPALAEQQALDDLRVLRTAEEEALGGVAAGGLEVADLLGGLDALGRHRQAERATELVRAGIRPLAGDAVHVDLAL
jgi:hypothetical protein